MIIQLIILNFLNSIRDFFLYTIRGKKSPYKKMLEKDPYIYEDE